MILQVDFELIFNNEGQSVLEEPGDLSSVLAVAVAD
jgi:hypothetical protein